MSKYRRFPINLHPKNRSCKLLFIAARPLRTIAIIPHPEVRISLFQYNDKYLIEIEGGSYRQTFKISTEAIRHPDDLKAMCNEPFIQSCIDRFRSMHADFQKTFQSISIKD